MDPSLVESDADKSYSQSTLLQTSQKQIGNNDAVIAQREREINDIAKGIIELSDIFRELQTMIIDQGTMLDRIDYNVERMGTDVKSADKELVVVCVITGELYFRSPSGRRTANLYQLRTELLTINLPHKQASGYQRRTTKRKILLLLLLLVVGMFIVLLVKPKRSTTSSPSSDKSLSEEESQRRQQHERHQPPELTRRLRRRDDSPLQNRYESALHRRRLQRRGPITEPLAAAHVWHELGIAV